MNLQELLKNYLEDDKITEFLEAMKTNKIFTASEENLDTRYSKLKGDYDVKDGELTKANELIEELKKSSKGNGDLQAKITNYDTEIAQLKAENEQLKIDNAIKVELLGSQAKASDLDYLMFKIKQDCKDLKLDENGKIIGFEVSDIKTAYPNNFEVESKKEVDVNNLPKVNDKTSPITKEQFDKMGYTEKNKLYQEDPETYKTLKNS